MPKQTTKLLRHKIFNNFNYFLIDLRNSTYLSQSVMGICATPDSMAALAIAGGTV